MKNAHFNVDYSPFRHATALFTEEMQEAELQVQRAARWATSSHSLDGLTERAEQVPYEYQGFGDRESFVRMRAPDGEGWVAAVVLEDGQVMTRVGAASAAIADGALETLRLLLPPLDYESEHRIPVTFWSLSPHGPQSIQRSVIVPSWVDIDINYSSSARDELERLIDPEFQPGLGGQMILWHGPPGTGKTFALRALGWEWRDWCDIHYITDPEVFFGDRAYYMLNVLLHEDSGPGRAKDRWRVLVLEDTGEMLAADAKERVGQGLSRLLNVVDGLIGQGLRILVLVTTNDELKTLHPAIARPGRCAALVEFRPLRIQEMSAWADAHGLDLAHLARKNEVTVADLYAAMEGARTAGGRQAVGFLP